MELTKNIFFNTDKLMQNSKVKISYTGVFFENNSEEVYIHYGFGVSWDNLSEIKMEKTELGFQTEIDLIESDTFNFCFRNGNNEWDNNEYQNYVFELEKPNLELIVEFIMNNLEVYAALENAPHKEICDQLKYDYTDRDPKEVLFEKIKIKEERDIIMAVAKRIQSTLEK